ncbi:glycosyltransferase family 2 protein [Salana multivorans]
MVALPADTPAVDLVIAVHRYDRQIERAVRSVLQGTRAAVRVTVVCHNLAREPILRALGEWAGSPSVRVVELHDGVRSPSGPFNCGLDLASAPFVSIMGSDDELESGAVDAWLDKAAREGADVVIPHIRLLGRGWVPTPPRRPWARRLDPLRDRLCYRTAPLGLMSRTLIDPLRFTPGLRTGEDVLFSTRLWFAASHVVIADRGADYLVHSDGPDRVTTAQHNLAQELAYLPEVLRFAQGLANEAERTAVVVKLLRVHVFGAVLKSAGQRPWTVSERRFLSLATLACRAIAPGAVDVLSRTEGRLLRALIAQRPPEELLVLAQLRSRPSPGALIPDRLSHVLAREAPLRFGGASVLARRHV